MYSPVWSVQAVAYSPNGQWIAVAGSPGIQIYDRTTLKLLQCLPSACTSVNSMAFMKYSPVLAVGGNQYGGTTAPVLEEWNVSTGVKMSTLPTQDNGYPAISSVAFSPDETMLVSAGTGPIEVWSPYTSKLIRTIQANGTPVHGIAISPDGKTLATAENTANFNFGTVLELWNLSTGANICSLPSAARQNNGVAFSPDGTKLVNCGFYWPTFTTTYTDVLEEWNVSTQKLITTLESTSNTNLNSVGFSPDGKTLVAAGYSVTAEQTDASLTEVWNVASSTKTNTLTGLGSQILTTAFSPDSKTLLTGGLPLSGYSQDAGDVCEFWNLSTGSLSSNLSTADYGYDGPLDFAYSPDSKTIAVGGSSALYSNVSGTYGGQVVLRNAATGALTTTLQSTANQGVGAVAYSPNGTILADGGSNYNISKNLYTGVLELWNTNTQKLIASLPSQCDNGVNGIHFSPDGTILAMTGVIYDSQIGENAGVLELWNVPSQKLIGYAIGKVNLQIVGVGFSPDDKTMVVGGYSYVANGNPVVALEVWNLTTGKVTAELPTNLTSITATAISSDGTTFVASGAGAKGPLTEYWNIAGTKIAFTLNYGGSDLQFSADGSILWLGNNGSATAFSSFTPALIGTYGVASNSPSHFVASHDGKSIAFLGYPNSSSNVGIVSNPLFGESVSAVSLSSNSVLGSVSTVATVTLASPAPAGRTAVYLGSSNPSVVPAITILVPAGATSATANVATVPVTAITNVTLTAKNAGQSKTVTLTVNPAVLSSLTLNVSSVVGGSSTAVTGTLTMSGPAPVGGYKVTLTSSSATATVAATVTVPTGATQVSFPIKTTAVTKSTTATIGATFGGVQQTASLTVTP